MHRILVEEKRWIGENRFLRALNYCMLLPGPEAQQLAVYIGWLLHKTKGGLVAGTDSDPGSADQGFPVQGRHDSVLAACSAIGVILRLTIGIVH
jgi:hypothetical protein